MALWNREDALEFLVKSWLQCGAIEPFGIIRRYRVGETNRAERQWVSHQRYPVLQIRAGGDHHVGAYRASQRELELPAEEAEASVGGSDDEGRGNAIIYQHRRAGDAIDEQRGQQRRRVTTSGGGHEGTAGQGYPSVLEKSRGNSMLFDWSSVARLSMRALRNWSGTSLAFVQMQELRDFQQSPMETLAIS